jgi:hypothetical protein
VHQALESDSSRMRTTLLMIAELCAVEKLAANRTAEQQRSELLHRVAQRLDRHGKMQLAGSKGGLLEYTEPCWESNMEIPG